MGFFSFITSDGNESIANIHSNRKTFPVYLATPGPNGKVFEEKEYNGYGVFGGKDIYVLIAELNNLLPNGTEEDKRMAGIDLIYKVIITDGTTSYIKGKDFTNWDKPIRNIGHSANELIHNQGFSIVYPNGYGDFNKAVEQGLIMPKLFEDRVNINYWDEFSYPTTCSYQGYFYEDFDVE
jgi:hypothetical protein